MCTTDFNVSLNFVVLHKMILHHIQRPFLRNDIVCCHVNRFHRAQACCWIHIADAYENFICIIRSSRFHGFIDLLHGKENSSCDSLKVDVTKLPSRDTPRTCWCHGIWMLQLLFNISYTNEMRRVLLGIIYDDSNKAIIPVHVFWNLMINFNLHLQTWYSFLFSYIESHSNINYFHSGSEHDPYDQNKIFLLAFLIH